MNKSEAQRAHDMMDPDFSRRSVRWTPAAAPQVPMQCAGGGYDEAAAQLHRRYLGAGAAQSALFLRTDRALWDAMLAINVTAAFTCIQTALPMMRGAGWGRVINIASTAGLKGYRYVSAYVAAKHALVGLTRSLALELAKHHYKQEHFKKAANGGSVQVRLRTATPPRYRAAPPFHPYHPCDHSHHSPRNGRTRGTKRYPI